MEQTPDTLTLLPSRTRRDHSRPFSFAAAERSHVVPGCVHCRCTEAAVANACGCIGGLSGEVSRACAPWESYRRGQGHELAIVTPPRTVRELADLIQGAANGSGLKYVVLIGDVGDVPTGYVDAKCTFRWGSEPTIAT